MLDNDIQNNIRSNTIDKMKDINPAYCDTDFQNDLEQNNNKFAEWRYFHEGTSQSANLEFISRFMKAIFRLLMKNVYSIWICMDSYNNSKDSIVEYHITPNVLFDGHKERILKKHRHDLLSAVMINLGGNEMISENRLIDMLTTLLSSEITKEEKKQKLSDDYQIPMTVEFELATRNRKN